MTVNYTENENKDKIRKKAENINSNKNREDKRNLNEVEKGEKEKSIRIYSYNSRGFDMIKQKVCMELLSLDKSRRNIICNQENFVLERNGHIIRQALPDHHVYIKPAIKDKLDGRPTNGMFTALPKMFRNKSKDVSPPNDRIQGILLETDGGSLLIINAYFPADPKTIAYNQDTKMESVLAAIENLIEVNQCSNVIIVGDLNTDYKRKNGRATRLDQFLSNNSLVAAWKEFPVDYTHEFEKDDISYTCTIDHVVWNAELRKKVTNAGVLHVVSNTSDHSPIFCDLESSITLEIESAPEKNGSGGISTKTMDDSDWNWFRELLHQKMVDITVPECLYCKEVHCKDESHILEIDSYTRDVLKAMDDSIKSVAMTKRNNVKEAKIIPGWSDTVKPFCDEAKFWDAVWKSAGKPLNNTLHQIMKRTRNRYHYAIRKCKKASENLKKDKLLNSCLNGKDNIFDELHRMRRVKNSLPTTIDGNKKPTERFAEVYGKLYSSANDRENTEQMLVEIEKSIDAKSVVDVELVTPEIIEKVALEIKSNKKDPVFTFNSSCVKHAPTSFYQHISNIIKVFLIHGHVSNMLLVATIVPLIKDKLGNIESSDNYRSIALSSVILKIFDWVIMVLFGDRLKLDDLQFSYQRNCSTTMCTWLVVESINHFSRNKTDVYTCFMDMKKAFDMVKHSTLFRKLVERDVPPIYLRLLLVMYLSQTAKVRWGSSISAEFEIQNGVKQGAVLSAILFCVYMDGLLKELRRNRDGCWINNEYVGVIVYADDIALLSPSLDGLQNMVDTCSRYAKSHNLTFSTNADPQKSKTKCMAFQQKKRVLFNLKLDGKALPWVTTVKHLGTTITTSDNCRMEQDLLEKRAAYIARNNELNQEYHYAYPQTKIWINSVFNTSFYGAPLWDLFSRNFKKMEKTWNVSMRIMLSLPRDTHRYFIEPLTGQPHIVKSLQRRFLKFVDNIMNGDKNVLRKVMEKIMYDTRSTTGKNLRHLRLMTTNCNVEELDVYSAPYQQVPEDELWRISMVRELMHRNEDHLGMSKEVLKEIRDYVCSS